MIFEEFEQKDEMFAKAARLLVNQILQDQKSVLAFPTGETAAYFYEPFFAELEKSHSDFDLSQIVVFNLDEYFPIEKQNPQSYFQFMERNFYSKARKFGLKMENCFIPSGEARDAIAECLEYEKKIKEKGGIDFAVLGLGRNGHVAFNEPGKCGDFTHLVELNEQTIMDNSRFFADSSLVPRHAITMGIETIRRSRQKIVLAFGPSKIWAIDGLKAGVKSLPMAQVCDENTLVFYSPK